jgi:cytosine/adenosine deaminase-related metal-dependent hydrolase
MTAAVTYTARWVFPVAGPPLAGGTVTVRGPVIEAVEPAGVRTADIDLGNVAVIPGLVNAHTHLDLSGARGRVPPTDPDHFTDWLLGVIAYRRDRTPEQVQADIRAGLAESLRHGTTLLGDIAAGGASWDAVAGAAVRGVVFWELIGLDSDRIHAMSVMSGAVAGVVWHDEDYPPGVVTKPDTPLCKWATSPHAPYSVRADFMPAYLMVTDRMACHVAEAPGERDLLERRAGPFVPFLERLGVYQPDAIANSWEQFLAPWREPQRPSTWLLVHANYLPTDFPFRPPHTVVYCPRTHAAFGHPTHPFRGFLARGVRVALGTDSLASNPDLDPLAEARFVKRRHPDVPGDVLLRMVALSGAEALGWADECGSLEPGKSADAVAVPLPDADAADPHDLLLEEGASDAPRRTMFRGAWRE